MAKEQALSAIAARIQQLAANGESYGLQLLHLNINPGSGTNHRRECLRSLALLP
jgi:uncharacterized protein (DUF58 family)